MSQLDPKAVWPGWKTVKIIGEGSFGAVYEIERELVSGEIEKAALKVISIPQDKKDIEELRTNGLDEESITAHFNDYLKDIIREYSLMTKVKGHTNVVYCDDIHYVQKDDGIGWDIFIKMELLTPLTEKLGLAYSEEDVVKVGRDIASALVLCKGENIIHRDIKPQNIFVSKGGEYKLGDFGIARTMEKTTSGTHGIGTLGYMAPEVYNNKPYGHTADIYSLGLVLYWMLNEQRMPFLPLPPSVLNAADTENARYRRFSGAQIPAPAHGCIELKRVIIKACMFKPEDRYQSASEMQKDLERIAINKTDFEYLDFKKEAEVRADKEGRKEKRGTIGLWTTPVYEKKVVEVSMKKEEVKNDSEGVGQIPLAKDYKDESNDQKVAYKHEDEYKDLLTKEKKAKAPAIRRQKKREKETEVTKENKKKGIWIAIGIIPILLLVAYFTIHIWTKDTCTTPATCIICGKTRESAPGHHWIDATCTTPKTCSVCGETEGSALGHSWKDATCTDPQTCTRCGATQGNALGHDWRSATCTDSQTCTRCGATQGNALGHSWKDATCTDPQICTRCGAIGESALGHNWIPATYDAPATCSRCGIKKGTPKAYVLDFNTAADINKNVVLMASSNAGSKIAVVQSNGTVIFAGPNEYGEGNTTEWKDIIQISEGNCHLLGLQKDGTVVSAGDNYAGQLNTSKWRDVVYIDAGQYSSAGVTSSGELVATVNYTERTGRGWHDLIAVSESYYHRAALRKDGTVVAGGQNEYGECDVGNWKDIIQVVTGYCFTAGLRKDGTVITAGNLLDFYEGTGDFDTSGWTDIVFLCGTMEGLMGLKSDGTIVYTGLDSVRNVITTSDWHDVGCIVGDYGSFIGIRRDGSYVATLWTRCPVDSIFTKKEMENRFLDK